MFFKIIIPNGEILREGSGHFFTPAKSLDAAIFSDNLFDYKVSGWLQRERKKISLSFQQKELLKVDEANPFQGERKKSRLANGEISAVPGRFLLP